MNESKTPGTLDDLFQELHECASRELASTGVPDSPPAYWLCVWDAAGFACSRSDGVRALHKLAVAKGAEACASITYYQDPSGLSMVVAQVVALPLDDSDLRSAALEIEGNVRRLSDWMRLV